MSVIRMPVTNIMVVTPMKDPEITEDHWLHRPRLEDRQGEIFCKSASECRLYLGLL